MIGRKFGRLTVAEFHSIGAGKMLKYRCACDCGGEAVCYGSNLRRGNSQSCGCLCVERIKEANTTHGRCHSPEHRTWSKILARCYNVNSPDYPDYGGRGITVCDEWHDFANFYADMGDRPSPQHSID